MRSGRIISVEGNWREPIKELKNEGMKGRKNWGK
jgi:hypothetical protein